MAKLPPIPDKLRRRAVAVVAAVWKDRPERQTWIADVCLRRWRSFDRRGVSSRDRDAQIRDVARGLVEASGEDRRLIGPVLVELRDLAERVLSAIDQWQSEQGEPSAAA